MFLSYRICRSRGRWACPGDSCASCRPCRYACRLGAARLGRAGCRRHRCHAPDPGDWSPGRLKVWCSGRRRPAPPPARAQLPQPPCCTRRARRSGPARPRGRPPALPHEDQQLAKTAKRSVHIASKVATTLSRLPTPPESKRDHGRSQLTAGQFYRARRRILGSDSSGGRRRLLAVKTTAGWRSVRLRHPEGSGISRGAGPEGWGTGSTAAQAPSFGQHRTGRGKCMLSLVEATTFGHGTQRVEIRKVQGSPV